MTRVAAFIGFLAAAAAQAGAVGSHAQQAAYAGTGQPADTVRYEVSFPNAVHHEAEISVTWRGLPPAPLEVRMSRSSPGRYALHEFAKNVYAVRATDGSGRELPVSRPNPHQWDIADHDGTVRVTYTLFADRADGTYAAVDLTQAHLNIPATFMWARGTADRPVAVRFQPRDGWRIATQLQSTSDPAYFTAPHLQYFMDSPTHLSAFDVREWQVDVGGPPQTIRIAMHHRGTAAQLDEYARHTQAIVREQAAVFGELPRFDFGTYTFIASYLPWSSGDGMEHRNSTILTSSTSLADNMLGLLGTVSHEFFHAWNVERLRPASLEPFDFERENMSGELWFAEGFTSYYGPLTMRRGGVTDDARYAASLTGMLNTVINAPGRRYFSPYEMSLQAPFVDAATSVDPQNRSNTFISYYTWGAALGLGLDLTIRSRFPGRTLDDYMRELWRRHGVHEDNFTPARPYTMQDLRSALGATVGDDAFAHDFFRRYVTGRDVVDYAALLARAGFAVRPARPGAPHIGGASLVAGEGGVIVAGPVLVGTTLHEAGLGPGDRIIAIDGKSVTIPEDVTAGIEHRRPGESVELRFHQRGAERVAAAVLREDPTLQVVLYEEAGLPVSDEIRAFRRAWLGARSR